MVRQSYPRHKYADLQFLQEVMIVLPEANTADLIRIFIDYDSREPVAYMPCLIASFHGPCRL